MTRMTRSKTKTKEPATAKKAARPAKAPRDPVKIAELVAKLADSEGMTEADVVRFPDLLKKVRLKPSDITGGIVLHAHRMNRAAIDATLAKYARKSRIEYVEPIAVKPAIEPTVKAPAEPKPDHRGGIRMRILGYTAAAVVRWMGAKRWTEEQATKVVRYFDCPMTTGHIRYYLKQGQQKLRLPAISKEHVRLLTEQKGK